MTEDLILRAKALKAKGIDPCLAILRVGERPDDLAYELGAEKRCETVGIRVKTVRLPAEAAQTELMRAIEAINADASVHGCLMFRPLPGTLDEKAACAALDPRKDVDGITTGSMAMVYAGSGTGYAPCTAQACMELLRYYGIAVAGKRIGTVTICHTGTRNLPEVTREADIVVSAAGKAEAFGADCFREGQTVLDVGISWSEEKQKTVGDVDFGQVEPIGAAISPVPGGVGSVTTAVLCRHVLEAAEKISA